MSPIPLRWTLASLTFAVLSGVSFGQAPGSLPEKAREVFAKHCVRCHADSNKAEGGFRWVQRADRLVALKHIVPGDAGKSPLFRRVSQEEMPPDEVRPRLTAAEIETIKKWIEAGARDWAKPIERKAIAIRDEAELVRVDREKQKERVGDASRFGYVTLTPLYNAGYSDDELQTVRDALAKLLNSLSWLPKFSIPEAVNAEKTLFRIDLEALGWTASKWAVLSETPFDFSLPAAREGERERLPIRADALIVKLASPPFYGHALDLPGTAAELEKRLGIDPLEPLKSENVLRAGYTRSEEAKHNRVVERRQGTHGYYWKTYDFTSEAARRNISQYPLGPGEPQRGDLFIFDTSSIIFRLPNGLQAYMLVDSRGNRIDRAPTEILFDRKRPDKAVEIGASCFGCHQSGVVDRADEIRPMIESRKRSFTADRKQDILAAYKPREQFSKRVEADRGDFHTALRAVGAAVGGADPINLTIERFNRPFTLRQAAAEMWVASEALVKSMEESKDGPLLRFKSLTAENANVNRGMFVPLARAALPSLAPDLRLEAPAKSDIVLAGPRLVKPVQAPTAMLKEHGTSATSSKTQIGALAPAIDPQFRFYLATDGKDRRVRMHDMEKGSVSKIIGEQTRPGGIEISRDGKILAVHGPDTTVRFFNAETGDEVSNTDQRPAKSAAPSMSRIQFTGAGREIAAVASGIHLPTIFFDPDSRKWKPGERFDDRNQVLGFSRDGKYELRTTDDGVHRIDRSSGKSVVAKCRAAGATVISVSDHDKWIAVSTKENSLLLIDFASMDLIRSEKIDIDRPGSIANSVHAITFSPNSESMVVTHAGGSITIWKTGGMELIGAVRVARNELLRRTIFSPDGKRIATSGLDGSVRIWDFDAMIKRIEAVKSLE